MVELVIDTGDPGMAGSLGRALRPDDAEPPRGFEISSTMDEGRIRYLIRFSGDERSILTLRNILDEILGLVDTMEETLKNLRKKESL